MASAWQDTEKTIQFPVSTPCDLCDSEDEVNSYCRNCVQKLCDICKRSHLRSPQSRDHIVVHISERPCLLDEPNICREHGHTLTFYCRTCHNLSCPKCLVIHHKVHDFVDTDEYAEELRSKSATLISQTEKEKLKQNIKAVEEAQETYLKDMKETKESVRNVSKRMINKIREFETGMLSEICKKEASDLEIFEKEKKRIRNEEKDLKKSIQKLKLDLKSNDNIAVVRSTELHQRNFSSMGIQNVATVVPLVHIVEDDGDTSLRKTVGYLQPKDSSPQNQQTVEFPRSKCTCGHKGRSYWERKHNKCKNCWKLLK